jgi:hypothetical protein
VFVGRASDDEIARFRAILDGLTSESCIVQRLILDSLFDVNCPEFVHAIANFHSVQYVSFGVSSQDVKDRLMTAFRRNGTMINSNATGGGLDASEQARMHVYHQRNHHL